MLTNKSLVNESEWIAYLEKNLTALEVQPSSSQVDTEGDRLGRITTVSSISKPLAEVALQPKAASIATSSVLISTASTGLVIKDQFRSGVIDRAIVADLDGATLSKSSLAIKAQPKLVISARQVYRQVTPVTILADPLRVNNFWLWADPQEDSVELEIPDRLRDRFSKDKVVKPLPSPILIDDRVINRGQIVRSIESSRLDRATSLNSFQTEALLLKLDRFQIQRIRLPIRQAFFAMATPELQAFRLTVRQNAVSAIVGGTVLLTVSIYSQAGEELLEKQRLVWTDALEEAGYGSHLWKFVPVDLRNLQALLDLDRQQLSAPIQVAINQNAGTATFLIELSAIGAQIWKQAIEQRQPSRIMGVGRFTVNFYARTSERLQIRQQLLEANLTTLLDNCGAEHIEILAPTLSLTTTLMVQSSPIVESVDVTWQPKNGSDSIHQSFDTQGGFLTGVVLTEDLNTVQIDWNTQVKYKLVGWAIGLQRGQLSLYNATEIIKPGSSEWVREYTLYTVFMAGQTQVAANATAFDDVEVEATFTFNAPYLLSPLATIFQPTHFAMTDVQFPIVPGQLPSHIGIMLTTKSRSSGKVLGTTQRVLNLEETLSNAKVFQDGRVEITTSLDANSESSIDADIFALLSQIRETDKR